MESVVHAGSATSPAQATSAQVPGASRPSPMHSADGPHSSSTKQPSVQKSRSQTKPSGHSASERHSTHRSSWQMPLSHSASERHSKQRPSSQRSPGPQGTRAHGSLSRSPTPSAHSPVVRHSRTSQPPAASRLMMMTTHRAPEPVFDFMGGWVPDFGSGASLADRGQRREPGAPSHRTLFLRSTQGGGSGDRSCCRHGQPSPWWVGMAASSIAANERNAHDDDRRRHPRRPRRRPVIRPVIRPLTLDPGRAERCQECQECQGWGPGPGLKKALRSCRCRASMADKTHESSPGFAPSRAVRLGEGARKRWGRTPPSSRRVPVGPV